MEITTVLLLLLLSFLIWLAANGLKRTRGGTWHEHDFTKMKRWDGSRWVYREMTQDESCESQSRNAW